MYEQVSFKNSPVRHTIPYCAELRHNWEEIRKLDEEQNWTERTQVVTKEDHKLYIDLTRVRNTRVSNVLFLINMYVKPMVLHMTASTQAPSHSWPGAWQDSVIRVCIKFL